MRARIASQIARIRHWTIIHGDYRQAPDIDATWFVDPPYQVMGKHYRHGAKGLDFDALADLTPSLRNEVTVTMRGTVFRNFGLAQIVDTAFLTALVLRLKREASLPVLACLLPPAPDSCCSCMALQELSTCASRRRSGLTHMCPPHAC